MALFTFTSSTQDHLDIEDIKEDLLICKSGQVSLVLETTAVNFDLLSESEQDVKILSFGQLLNSLNFYVQILVKTERMDVTRYIERIGEQRSQTDNKDLQRQIDIYSQFIKNLTVKNEILDKRFFICISSLATAVIKTNPLKQALGKPERIINLPQVVERAQGILHPRRDHLVKQMQRMMIFARQLNTNELIKLFYSSYNPDTMGLQKLQIKYDDITSAIV